MAGNFDSSLEHDAKQTASKSAKAVCKNVVFFSIVVLLLNRLCLS